MKLRVLSGPLSGIAALGREPQVSRVAIRTAVADLRPGRAPHQAGDPAVVVLEMPGKLAHHLRDRDDLGEAEREAPAARSGAARASPCTSPSLRSWKFV